MRTRTRRQFIKRSAAALGTALAAPLIVPARSPSDRLTMGAIGLGNRGRHDLGHFLREQDVRCVAVCDCFPNRLRQGKDMVDRHYGNTDCQAYKRHEDVLGRRDIDFVLIATGDRWHTPLSILAARAGKDIYCEKPICLTIGEGRALVSTTQRYGTVWQCGTQRRSNGSYAFATEIVRSGALGRLKTITASYGDWGGNGFATPEPVPDGFDYDRWSGQAPWAPYSRVRVGLWRNNWDTGAGPIADMGPHYLDFAQWANNTQLTGPETFEGEGVFPEDGFANVPFTVNVSATYRNGVRIVMNSGAKATRFDAENGWISVSDEGVITAGPESILKGREVPRVHWSHMRGHIRDSLSCIWSRKLTVSHPEVAHRAHTIAHVANLSLRLGRKLTWNPDTEKFVNDAEADRMLTRTMRAPWRV